jgi:hypothetical protein
LNLLRSLRLNPRLSAEAQLNGAFDYNRTSLAPPGTKVIVHKTSSVRRSWAPHGVDGWYIGAAPHHYRCWRVFIPQTAGKRYSNTVKFFPTTVPMPQLSSADAATQAIRDLLHLHTSFWHCNMLLRYCDIVMTFLSQNFRVFPRAMSLVPEVCPISQNTSHTYVSTCHTYVSTSTNHGKLQLIIGLTQSSVSFN